MKIKLYFLFSTFLLANNCFAQTTFQKVMSAGAGSAGFAVQQTNDGNYIIGGYTLSSDSAYTYVYLVKVSAEGDTLWTKTYGGMNTPGGYSIQQTTDNGFIVTGYIFDTTGNQKVYLIKTDSNGDTLWTKAYGGIYSDIGNYVRQTNDGGYIITGSTLSFGQGEQDVYLIKTDAAGNITWTKTYGGMALDVGYIVRQTADSGYIICGQTESFGDGNNDAYLIRTKANGDTLWTKTYGGAGDDYAYFIEQTKDSGFIFTGSTDSFGAGNADVCLIKTDVNGDTLWIKTYGGAEDDVGYEVHQTTDGGYIITGYTTSFGDSAGDVYLIKTGPNGDTLWTKTYAGNNGEVGYSGRQTNDGGYIIVAFTNSFDPLQIDGAMNLIKTDTNANSGCFQSGTNTIVGYAAMKVAGTQTIIDSGGTASYISGVIGSGGNDSTLCITVGIHEQSISNGISLYPNPAENQLIIKSEELIMGKFIVYIMNTLGQTVMQFSIFNFQSSINVSSLPSGLYLVRISGEDESWAGKFVKE